MDDKFGKKYLVDFDNKPYFKAGNIFTLCKNDGSDFIVQFEDQSSKKFRRQS